MGDSESVGYDGEMPLVYDKSTANSKRGSMLPLFGVLVAYV